MPREPEPQFIVQRNNLKNRAQFMKTIRALSQNVQAEIDFCVRWDADFRHEFD
jgi:hypothetical protein